MSPRTTSAHLTWTSPSNQRQPSHLLSPVPNLQRTKNIPKIQVWPDQAIVLHIHHGSAPPHFSKSDPHPSTTFLCSLSLCPGGIQYDSSIVQKPPTRNLPFLAPLSGVMESSWFMQMQPLQQRMLVVCSTHLVEHVVVALATGLKPLITHFGSNNLKHLC